MMHNIISRFKLISQGICYNHHGQRLLLTVNLCHIVLGIGPLHSSMAMLYHKKEASHHRHTASVITSVTY